MSLARRGKEKLKGLAFNRYLPSEKAARILA